MSLDKAFRDMIRGEVEAQLRPLQQAVRELQTGMGDVEQMRAAAEALLPMANILGQLVGGRAVALPAPARRGPGRPRGGRGGAAGGNRGGAEATGRRGRKGGEAAARECAIKGCGKPSRTKGYCAAHYQKLRMLERTGRRPSAWMDHAAPSSVDDVKLPRGRAASKALKESRQQG